MANAVANFDVVLRLIEHIDWSPRQLAAHRTRRLRDLLAHAATHSRFWRDRLQGFDIQKARVEDLAALPVLSKADLMAHWDEIVTVPGLSLDACRKHLSSLPEQPAPEDFDLCGCLVLSTGGTSGEQAIVVHAQAAWNAGNEAHRRWMIRRIMALGVTPDPNIVMAGVFGDTPRHYASALTRRNGIHVVPVNLPLGDQCTSLNTLQPAVLNGYPSALVRLADAAVAGRLRIDPLTITSGGECLTDEVWRALRTAWPQTRIFDGYGCTECGMLAASTGGEDRGLYVNDDLVVVEPLDVAGRPVAAGEPGTTLAVTCLENRVLPLIRYEITDRVTVSPEPSPEGLAFTRLARVEGRTSDWLRWGDTEVHPCVFTTPLTDDPGVDLYQVRQVEGGAEILVVCRDGMTVNGERLLAEITKGLQLAGAPAALSLTCVDEIPRVGDGQKHKTIVPLA